MQWRDLEDAAVKPCKRQSEGPIQNLLPGANRDCWCTQKHNHSAAMTFSAGSCRGPQNATAE